MDAAKLKLSLDEVTAAKLKLTSLLTTYVTLYNQPVGSVSRTQMNAALTAYVKQFDLLTLATNTLRVRLAEETADPISLVRVNMLTATISIKDAEGARWDFGTTAVNGERAIRREGKQVGSTVGIEICIKNGVAWYKSGLGTWWSYKKLVASGAWVSQSSPPYTEGAPPTTTVAA